MKKRGFDKKSAHRFNLMHRSQQDPLFHAEGGNQVVLHPSDQKTAESLHRMPFTKAMGVENFMIKEFREVDEMGLPLDGYDYSKHLSSVGGGTFMSASGVVEKIPDALVRAKTEVPVMEMPSELLASETEMPRMLEAITLRPDLMDPEMRRIFEGEVDEEEVEELDDDFMEKIITGRVEASGAAEDEDGFDFDAHVERLMKQAEGEFENDDDEDEDGEEKGLGEASGPLRAPRDVDEHFERVMKEYEEEEDEEDPDEEEPEDGQGNDEEGSKIHSAVHARGALEAADRIVLEALSEFMREAAENRSLGDVAHPPPREAVLAKTEVALQDEAAGEEEEDDVFEPATEGDVLDAWGTYKYTTKPQFDCETIVSQLSTLDNHPAMIEVPGRLRNKAREPKANAQPRSPASSSVASDALAHDVARLSIDAIAARVKGESAEEKRARKQAVKEAKRERRVDKKALKNEFKQEKQRLIHALTAPNAPKSGVSEFKI